MTKPTPRLTSHPFGRRTMLGAALAAAATATATACGFEGNDAPEPNESGGTGPVTLYQSMLPVTHLDPHISGNSSFGQIMMIGLWEGLVTINADNPLEVLPGVAEEWEVSDDQLTYTFHLNADRKWSNGDPITAQDFVWNWERLLNPETAGEGSPSYPRALRVVGAEALLIGASTDFSSVGVEAPDDATFVVTLEAPNPDALVHLAQYWGLPLHPGTIEEKGDAWLTGDGWVSNGPYILDDFRVNQSATLLRNDEYWDGGNYHLDRWEVSFNDGGTTADLLAYQQDEIQITGRIEDDLEAVTNSDVAQELISSPTNQIRQLNMMASRNTALYDVRVREALAISIDREALGDIATPSIAGPSLLPEAAADYDKVFQIPFDPERGAQLLEEAGFPGGEGMPTIQLLDFQNSPWVQAIGQMWTDNLGVNVEFDIVDVGVYGTKRQEVHDEDYTGFFVNNVAVNPPSLFTFVGGKVTPSSGYVGLTVAEADVAQEVFDAKEEGIAGQDLVDLIEGKRPAEIEEAREFARSAMAETDPAKQNEMFIEAATKFNQLYTVIPVLWGGYNLLVKPEIKGLKPWFYSSVFTTKGVTIES